MAVVGRGSAIFDLSIPVSAASPEFWVGAAESLVCLAKCIAHAQSAPAAKLHRPSAFRPHGSTLKARWRFTDALFYFLQSPLHCAWNWKNTASTSANQRVPLCAFPTREPSTSCFKHSGLAKPVQGSVRMARMREASGLKRRPETSDHQTPATRATVQVVLRLYRVWSSSRRR